jgi:hypothetical protein
MKVTNLDDRIHVLDAETDVWKVVRDIAESGVSSADKFLFEQTVQIKLVLIQHWSYITENFSML